MNGFDDEVPSEEEGSALGLKPLPADLRPEMREFVCAMRRLLGRTGKSLRQFATYHHFSPASASRYLNGKRLPDKVFVDALLKSACRAHGIDLTPEVQEHAYRLHREALLTEQPGRYRLQMASDQLEEAVLAREQAELTLRELQSSVSDQKHRLALLERQKYEITHAAAEERRRTGAEIAHYRGRERALGTQCDELRDEIARLEAELRRAESERDVALARCQELEECLVPVEEEAEQDELRGRLDEARREMATADAQAVRRIADLERAEADAEFLRRRAAREAAEKTTEATELLTAAREEADRVRAEVRAVELRREDINEEISRVQDVLEALESFEAPSSRVTGGGIRAGGTAQRGTLTGAAAADAAERAAADEAERVLEEKRAEILVARRRREEIDKEAARVQDVLDALEAFDLPGPGTPRTDPGTSAPGTGVPAPAPPDTRAPGAGRAAGDTRPPRRGRHRRPGPGERPGT